MSVAHDKTAPKDGVFPEPKKRGRPPKNPDAALKKPGRPKKQKVGNEQDPFAEKSAVAPIAVPEVAEEVGPVVEPQQPAQPVEPVVAPIHDGNQQPPPPTRSTFAGRTRVGSETFQSQWDSRRQKYYKCVPSEFWKDAMERTFWSMASELGCLDKAMDQFLLKIDASKPSQPLQGFASPPVRQAKKPKVVAKAKAKAAVKSTRSRPAGGRGRGVGRGRAKGASMACH